MALGISVSKGHRQAGLRDFCGIKHTQKLRTVVISWYSCSVCSVEHGIQHGENAKSTDLTQT